MRHCTFLFATVYLLLGGALQSNVAFAQTLTFPSYEACVNYRGELSAKAGSLTKAASDIWSSSGRITPQVGELQRQARELFDQLYKVKCFFRPENGEERAEATISGMKSLASRMLRQKVNVGAHLWIEHRLAEINENKVQLKQKLENALSDAERLKIESQAPAPNLAINNLGNPTKEAAEPPPPKPIIPTLPKGVAAVHYTKNGQPIYIPDLPTDECVNQTYKKRKVCAIGDHACVQVTEFTMEMCRHDNPEAVKKNIRAYFNIYSIF